MMRALWTAASGMTSMQLNVDTISNNLSNVNTNGYKKERLEFKTLLYETMQKADLDPSYASGRPVNLQVGHGVRPIATSRGFTQGNLQVTNNYLDFAIEGNGFFVIDRGDGNITYTRDGAFKLTLVDEGSMFVTSDGYPVLGLDGEPIIIPYEIMPSSVIVDENGVFYYPDADNLTQELGFRLDVVQFYNPQGLHADGANLFVETSASGPALREAYGETQKLSRIRQNAIESSNVAVAEEMVNLIVAQRAYELNSKAIQTSDDMLQQANNLKR